LLAELLESEKFSRSDIEEYQNEKLRELIAHAYENVPYYREVMDNLRLVPADIRTREDLPKLPLLTKELVRQNSDKLISRITDKRELQYKHTGGTTGTSLHFLFGQAVTAFQWALWWRHRKRFGLELGDLHVNFTGKLVVPPEQRSRIYWRWNSPMGKPLSTCTT
jgi:phenylacetate-CoA ligase